MTQSTFWPMRSGAEERMLEGMDNSHRTAEWINSDETVLAMPVIGGHEVYLLVSPVDGQIVAAHTDPDIATLHASLTVWEC